MGSKKRSLTGGEDMEPTMKKNKSERVDLYGKFVIYFEKLNINYNFNNFRLFGNEDVDLRTLGVDSDSSAISDKKNASKLVSC